MSRAKFSKAAQIKDTDLDQGDFFASDNGNELKQELKTLTLRLDNDSWKELKMLSIQLEKPVTKIMREALNDYFVKSGKAPKIK